MRAAVCILAMAALAVASSGCESSQTKSKRLAKHAKGLLHQKGLTVTRENDAVKVVDSAVVHDANGTAVVLSLRNGTARAQERIPVAIDVTDAGGTSLFRNDAPGLEGSLVEAAVVPANHRAVWVNDQVTASGKPAKVTAKLGPSASTFTGPLPRIAVSRVHLLNDVDGTYAEGFVANQSKIAQRDLVIFGVVRRNGRVVAAGRAIVPRLKAPTKKPVRFSIYFIGDPRRGRLHIDALPTILR